MYLSNSVDQYLWLMNDITELCMSKKFIHIAKLLDFNVTNMKSSLMGFKIPHLREFSRYYHLLSFGIKSDTIHNCLKKPWNIPSFFSCISFESEVGFPSYSSIKMTHCGWLGAEASRMIQYLLLRQTLKRFVKPYASFRILLLYFLGKYSWF